MDNIIVGLLAVAAGLVFCLGGVLVMRVVIPIWGFFAGFVTGAGLVSAVTDEGVLTTVLGWGVGFAVAVLFSALAYLYFAVSVLLVMSTVGFALGSGLMVAMGVRWSWVIVLVGVALGVLFAVAALLVDAPTIVLIVLTALGGAAATVFGALLLVGTLDVEDLRTASATELVSDEWWTYALFVVLAVVGAVVQSRAAADLHMSMRELWDDSARSAPSSHAA